MNPHGMLPSPWCVDVCVWRVVFPCECLSRSHFCGLCFPIFKTWHVWMCLLLVLACVYALFFCLCIYPTCLYSQVCVHAHECVSVCVCICVQPHFLCACWSILAFGEKDAVHSPRLRRFQHWIRDGAMICGNDFLNATNLCFPPSLPFTLFLSLSLSLSLIPPPPPLLGWWIRPAVCA